MLEFLVRCIMADGNLGRTPLEDGTEYLLLMESQNIMQQPNKAASFLFSSEGYLIKN